MVRKRRLVIQPRDWLFFLIKQSTRFHAYLGACMAAQFNESKLIYDGLKEYFFSSSNKSMGIFYHPASQSQILHQLPFLLRNQKDMAATATCGDPCWWNTSRITNLHYEYLFLGTCSIATFNISYLTAIIHLWTLIYWNSSLFSGPSLIEACMRRHEHKSRYQNKTISLGYNVDCLGSHLLCLWLWITWSKLFKLCFPCLIEKHK